MSTFEEDAVDIYFNLKGYFTIKNIPFSAIEKRPGGRGRGEIDVLAVKTDGNKITDAVWAEVSVSVTSAFPFKSEKGNVDESKKLLKKFFLSDARHKIREYIGNMNPRLIFVSSMFNGKSAERLESRLGTFGAQVIVIRNENERIHAKIIHGETEGEIEIIPFPCLMKEIKRLYGERGFLKKNFQDSRLRGLQYLVKEMGEER